MDQEKKQPRSTTASEPGAQTPEAVDQFFDQIQSDMRRPDVSQEAVAAAFQAIQRLALEADAEAPSDEDPPPPRQTAPADVCAACGARNSLDNRFCATCGVPLQEAQSTAPNAEPPAPARHSGSGGPSQGGQHSYHHHYHHHYFASAGGLAQGIPVEAQAAAGSAVREPVRGRTSGGVGTFSKAEIAVRRMSQDWTQACNTKQLDDLVDLYAADAVVLRSNVPPVRGTAAIREFLFAALDAGLGEVELEPLRVEVLGEVAFEAGRCKMLVPVAMGKRREERGKYLMVFVRQAAGNWKTVADCWSSDLSLVTGVEPAAQAAGPVRPTRK